MSEWISVDDALPETSHDEIIVWNGRWSRVASYLMTSDKGAAFLTPHGDLIPAVTHWKLNPPPKN